MTILKMTKLPTINQRNRETIIAAIYKNGPMDFDALLKFLGRQSQGKAILTDHVNKMLKDSQLILDGSMLVLDEEILAWTQEKEEMRVEKFGPVTVSRTPFEFKPLDMSAFDDVKKRLRKDMFYRVV